MKFEKVLPMLFVAAAAFGSVVSVTSCNKPDDPIVIEEPDDTTKASSRILTGEISSNRTLDSDSAWTIKGYVYVKAGATLTINPGTILRSDIVEKGAIIV